MEHILYILYISMNDWGEDKGRETVGTVCSLFGESFFNVWAAQKKVNFCKSSQSSMSTLWTEQLRATQMQPHRFSAFSLPQSSHP